MSIQKAEKNLEEKVSAEDLIKRARDMIPWLREKAEQVEEMRMVPKDVIEEFRKAGFYKIVQPKRWGGYEMDLDVFHRVLMEIGRASPSCAWILGILGIHSWEVALLDPKAGDDVWGSNPDSLISSTYYPFGKVRKVDGGWVLNGQWRTSSGVDHAEWTFVGGYVYDENGKVEDYRAYLVPRSEFTVIDDWYVLGLAGTGSKSIELEEVFVPEYRSHSLVNQPWSGRPPLYSLHQTFVFFTTMSSVTIGMGIGAVDLYTEHMKSRVILKNGMRAAQSPHIKSRLGHAVNKVRSARARLLLAVKEAMEYVKRGEPVPLDALVYFMNDSMSAGTDCSDAAIMLHRAQSSQGVLLSNPMQRQLRDILTAANHGTQNIDRSTEMLGGYLLGEGVPGMLFNLNGFPAAQ